mmetsp:Transcript_3699/g.10484  ORF Transcript_3699/g.10484 Transcript_3699/m.10484 type:complete len:305 (-) Transcript_3699:1474-2388(-)
MDPFENSDYGKRGKVSKVRKALHGLAAPVKRTYGRCHTPGSNAFLGLVWVISGVLTVLIPLLYRSVHMSKYREEYMKYFWEEEYETYVKQQQENYEQYGNDYNYGGAYMGGDYYSQNEYYDVNRCQWWQFNCFSFFVSADGEPMEDQEWYPAWYSGFSRTQEQREQMQENLEQPGSLKFVYIWQIVLFIVLGCYGLLIIQQNRNPTGLIVGLLVWSNFAFLSMWLMADGSIVTDGQQVKRTGFYGQLSVLIFMTNFWYFLHGLAFLVVFWIRSSCLAEQEARKEENKTVQASTGEEYKAPATTH